jgi:glucose/arabinose dehydrogenase
VIDMRGASWIGTGGRGLAAAMIAAACGLGPHAAAQSGAAEESTAEALPSIVYEPAFPKLSFIRPVQITHAPDGTNRFFVVEQPGRIRVFEADRTTERAGVFLDIKDGVFDRHNEEGLLSLAFHPEYASNGAFFVYYTAKEPRRGVIARFTVDPEDPNRADPASMSVVLEVEQPYGNHNGSTLLFGPDGYLYASLGDGGAANDPHDHGQNLSTLLGTIIRIDVDRTEGDTAYAVPADNPFVGETGVRPEIWAYGLRNVWRMSFDRKTGDLWAGDVGQVRWEEIDIIRKGGNYGWRIREGFHPFREGESTRPLLDPVVDYGRQYGMSVTGGYVYRGQRHPRLQGVYLYADYVSGRVWGLRQRDGKAIANREVLAESSRRHVSSFGEGPDGELYVTTFEKLDRRGGRGRVFRIGVGN